MFVIFETPCNLVDSYQLMRSYIPWRDSRWNIFHSSTSFSYKWSVQFRFVLYIRMSLKWSTSCPSHPTPFHHLNNICWTLKIVKLALLVIKCLKLSLYFLSLIRYSLQSHYSRATSVYITEAKFRSLMQPASSYITSVGIKHQTFLELNLLLFMNKRACKTVVSFNTNLPTSLWI